jgi:magnesium transporter
VSAQQPKADLNDPITAHMRRDFARLGISQTVGGALDWLRAHPPRERILYFYVADGDGRLCGVVPTRRLILAAPEVPLADIMVRQVITMAAEATVLEACELFIQHRLLAFPVVDRERRILGVVDIDLYTEELQDLGDASKRDEMFQQVGINRASGEAASPWAAFRRRFPWLGCNLGAGILAAVLCGAYEKELKGVVALAFFIPVVLNLAESVSSQSVSLALQALHSRQPTWRLLLRSLRAELLTGLLLGVAVGTVVALADLVWLGDLRLALCLVGGVSVGVAASAVLGLAMPMVLRLLRLEPRVAAGPVALAGADIITILVYFNLARGLWG